MRTHSTLHRIVLNSSFVAAVLPSIFLSEVFTERTNSQNPPHHGATSALNFHVIFLPDAESFISLEVYNYENRFSSLLALF